MMGGSSINLNNSSDIDTMGYSDIILLPEPTAATNDQAVKPPGFWEDEQKLTLETFKEVVATDVENVWVIAYIDPRCSDCVTLSVEWEHLTHIEEKERRKVKLGYVDISVEENWKIVQDHTKGKKMTHTPAVTMYGDNKESPYWYEREQKPSADGVHTWVSSYADAFGYGYWDPDQYLGASVIPKKTNHFYIDKKGSSVRYFVDTARHEGALSYAGVKTGFKGKGYLTEGKWVKGDQITQLRHNKDQTVMRRRTVSEGGKLSGAAHAKPDYDPTGVAQYEKTPHGGHQGHGHQGYGHQGQYGQQGGYYDKYGRYH